MKVRYISEGIFMNPAQARAARANTGKNHENCSQDKIIGLYPRFDK